ncbi:MAG: hypothetical protein K0R62_4112 [Nonomuraea muscovyensis]|nr:hypothetical protein [Nonomuraea muscovyensis]
MTPGGCPGPPRDMLDRIAGGWPIQIRLAGRRGHRLTGAGQAAAPNQRASAARRASRSPEPGRAESVAQAT